MLSFSVKDIIDILLVCPKFKSSERRNVCSHMK